MSEEKKPKLGGWYAHYVLAVLVILAAANPVLNPYEDVTREAGPLLVVADDGWAAAPDWNSRAEILRRIADVAEHLYPSPKLLILNYPHNPTALTVDGVEFFEYVDRDVFNGVAYFYSVTATDFRAETTLTRDTVPVNVDAIAFWLVWDAKMSVLEVEDFVQAVILSAQTALREQLELDVQSVSGVNLDEEAVNALRYQEAFMASSKIVALADELFISILNMVSRN